MADNENDEIVQYVEITNLHHHPQNLNGFYIATETTREDRFVYKKDNSSIILWFYYFTENKSLWMISEEEHLDSQNAYACTQSKAKDPTKIYAGVWFSFDLTVNKFVKQSSVQINASKPPVSHQAIVISVNGPKENDSMDDVKADMLAQTEKEDDNAMFSECISGEVSMLFDPAQIDVNNVKIKCGQKFSKSSPNIDPASKKVFEDGIYGTIFSPITCYCHHFTEDMRHCVANGLGPDAAQLCRGVMYGHVLSPTTLECKEPRKDMSGHKPCNEKTCPWVKAKMICPFSAPTPA